MFLHSDIQDKLNMKVSGAFSLFFQQITLARDKSLITVVNNFSPKTHSLRSCIDLYRYRQKLYSFSHFNN